MSPSTTHSCRVKMYELDTKAPWQADCCSDPERRISATHESGAKEEVFEGALIHLSVVQGDLLTWQCSTIVLISSKGRLERYYWHKSKQDIAPTHDVIALFSLDSPRVLITAHSISSVSTQKLHNFITLFCFKHCSNVRCYVAKFHEWAYEQTYRH